MFDNRSNSWSILYPGTLTTRSLRCCTAQSANSSADLFSVGGVKSFMLSSSGSRDLRGDRCLVCILREEFASLVSICPSRDLQ